MSTSRPVIASERRFLCEPARGPLQEVVRVGAVVVGERDEVGAQCERAAFRARERPGGEVSRTTSSSVRLEQRVEPLVRVLVDEDDAERSVRLPLERGEQSRRLGGAADRADDEVPGREGRAAHRE